MTIGEELGEFALKMEEDAMCGAPSFLTLIDRTVSIVPGSNLDMVHISFNFRLDRTTVLMSEIPEELKDPSRTVLEVVK